MLAFGLVLGVLTHRSTGLGAAANEAFATSTGPWTVVAALIGRFAPDVKSAIVTATVCLWSATIAFYVAGGPLGNGGTPGFWLAAIIVLGPLLGWLGRASAAHGIAGSLAASVIAGWLIGEALHTALAYGGYHWFAARWYHGATGWHLALVHDASSRWFSVAVDGLAAACWLLATRGPRRVVAAAIVPMTAAAAAAIALASPLLGSTVR